MKGLEELLQSELEKSPELKASVEEVKRNTGEVQPPIVFTRGELSVLRCGLKLIERMFDRPGNPIEALDNALAGGMMNAARASASKKLDEALDDARARSIAASKEARRA